MKCSNCGHESKVRTTKQNSSLHKFFSIISDQLNDMGAEFNYTGIKGVEMSMPYTPTLIKETLWKPIQIALFDFESTTQLDTKQINQIVDVINKFFSERGVSIDFPSIEQLS